MRGGRFDGREAEITHTNVYDFPYRDDPGPLAEYSRMPPPSQWFTSLAEWRAYMEKHFPKHLTRTVRYVGTNLSDSKGRRIYIPEEWLG